MDYTIHYFPSYVLFTDVKNLRRNLQIEIDFYHLPSISFLILMDLHKQFLFLVIFGICKFIFDCTTYCYVTFFVFKGNIIFVCIDVTLRWNNSILPWLANISHTEILARLFSLILIIRGNPYKFGPFTSKCFSQIGLNLNLPNFYKLTQLDNCYAQGYS